MKCVNEDVEAQVFQIRNSIKTFNEVVDVDRITYKIFLNDGI